jgi:hypothetical protein
MLGPTRRLFSARSIVLERYNLDTGHWRALGQVEWYLVYGVCWPVPHRAGGGGPLSYFGCSFNIEDQVIFLRCGAKKPPFGHRLIRWH